MVLRQEIQTTDAHENLYTYGIRLSFPPLFTPSLFWT